MTQPHAAGALMSTAIDVDRWQRALHDGRVLSNDMYQRMITPDSVAEQSSRGHAYGYGLQIADWMGYPAIYHGGGINGFTTMAFWLPDPELSIVLLTNRAGPGYSTQDMTLRLAGLVMDKPYPGELPALALPSEELAAYQGTFRIDDNSVRTLRVEDGQLISQRQSGPEFRVIPVAGDRLIFEQSLSWFSVERDESGAIHAVALHQGWGAEPERAEKISDEVVVREPVEVAESDLERLVGRYQLMPGFILAVRVNKGQLEIQGTNQPALIVLAESPHRFYSTQAGADIEFDLPETGPATALTLYQGGQELPAPRLEGEPESN